MQRFDILELAGLRIDGRKPSELRPLTHRIGVTTYTDGSAYFEHGLNKVLAMVIGPHEPKKRNTDVNSSDDCKIDCSVQYAPFAMSERKKRRQGDRRVIEQERIIEEVTGSVVLTDLYPRSEISIVVHIFEADG